MAENEDQQTAAPPSDTAPGDTEHDRRLLSRVADVFREGRRRRRFSRSPDVEDEEEPEEPGT